MLFNTFYIIVSFKIFWWIVVIFQAWWYDHCSARFSPDVKSHWEASNWTHRDEHRSAVNQNKKRAKLNVETIQPGRETSASRLASHTRTHTHTHTSIQTITVLKHLPRTAHPADVHDSEWLMAAHRTSRSPAFSRLIDAPVCLTDGQMWHGGKHPGRERHLGRAAISSHFLLSEEIMRRRQK